MAASVATAPEFHADKPRVLFQGKYQGYYDITRDGRFLMIKGSDQETVPTQIALVLNWFGELRGAIGRN